MPFLKGNEVINDLILSGLKIIQKGDNFRFSIDAVLLAHFAAVKKGDKILDLGTGTGVIPLILSTRQPSLDITGIEIQKELAEMATRSMKLNNLESITVINGDLRELSQEYFNKYDLVISNPPYYPLNQGKISPKKEIAISRHELTCTIIDLITAARKLLKNKGKLALIHKADRLGELVVSLINGGLEPKRMRFIHPYGHKPANLVLIEAVKGAKGGLVVEEPLIIYNNAGNYTEEVLKYYFGGETCGK